MNAKVDQIAKTLEAAKAMYDSGIDSLKNNGRSVFAPDEEQRRRQELTATYQAAQRVAQDALQAAIAGAEQAIVEAGVADPLARLVSGDLEKAGQLRAFISEDYERLPIETLAEMAREALEGGDRATIAVHLRYGRQAISVRFNRPGEASELRQAVTELEDTFTDRAKRDAAQATIDAAQKFQLSMATANYLEKTYGNTRPARVA